MRHLPVIFSMAAIAVASAEPAKTNVSASATVTNLPIVVGREPEALTGELSLSGKELKIAQEQFDRGVLLLRVRSFGAAAEAFRKALAANPYQSETHANLAVALVQLGQQSSQQQDKLRNWQSAAEHLSKAAELKPREKTTFLLWAETLVLIGDLPLDANLRLGCYQGALEKCQRASEIAQDDWEPYSKWAGILSVKLADFAVNDEVRLNVYKEAASLFGKAAERAAYSGDLGFVYANWGTALVRAARLTSDRGEKEAILREALDKYDRSIRAVSKSARTWALWGTATLELAGLTKSRNDYRDGVDRLNTALSYNNDDPGSLYNLACGYAQMGNRILAIESLRKCFEMDKNRAYLALAAQEPDLAVLRNEEAFRELMEQYNKYGIPSYNPPLRDSTQ
jgi:tetratricopeptide (TPR) repeat protein